jgi:hypothetical protein
MRVNQTSKIGTWLMAIASVAGLSTVAVAQGSYGSGSQTTGLSQQQGPQAGTAPASGMQTELVNFTATVVKQQEDAAKGYVTVRVNAADLQLVDFTDNEQPRAGQGHIHYQVDDGPVIMTTDTEIAFGGPAIPTNRLGPGSHHIRVWLAGNDHRPISRLETFDVTIPALPAESAQPGSQPLGQR